MTEQEAVIELYKICEGRDEETEHPMSEDLLCHFLREQGFYKLANAFDDVRVNFWYA